MCMLLPDQLAGKKSEHCGSATTEWVCFACLTGRHSSKLISKVSATAKQGSSKSVLLGRDHYTASSSTLSNKLSVARTRKYASRQQCHQEGLAEGIIIQISVQSLLSWWSLSTRLIKSVLTRGLRFCFLLIKPAFSSHIWGASKVHMQRALSTQPDRCIIP